MVSTPAPVRSASPAQEKPAVNTGRITMEEFKNIESGMTYQQVVEIIGSEGELMSEVDFGM
jgi:outer membrane protein assembly factor BamE (lipoprotein component of BamABCDE complex)